MKEAANVLHCAQIHCDKADAQHVSWGILPLLLINSEMSDCTSGINMFYFKHQPKNNHRLNSAAQSRLWKGSSDKLIFGAG